METTTLSSQEPRLGLDINAQRNFIKYYKKLGEKPPTTVRFFERLNYYTVHGTDDCELVSNLVYKSDAAVHKMLAQEPLEALTYVTLSKFNFELALRELLLVRKLRVEVYVQPAAGDEWRVEYSGSPGNLLQFEDILFANKEMLVGNNLLSLQVRLVGTQRKLGVAAVEQNDCTFQLVEFVDDDFLTELEATIVLLGPRECLLPSVEGEYEAVKKLLERNGVMVSLAKKSSARNAAAEKDDLIQDLNRLLRFAKGQKEDAAGLPEMELSLATDALRLAIKYLDLVNDAANLGHYELKQLNLNRFVHLDAAAVTALNLFPQPGAPSKSAAYRWRSVLGVLDRCSTPQGHRLLAQWLKQPLRSREILNDRHDVVQCLLESPTTLTALHDTHLKRIPDLLMLTKRLMRRKATLQELFRIYQVLLRMPRIITALLELEHTTVRSMLCDPLKSCLEDLLGLKKMVEQVMDFDAVEEREYLVKASFDDALKDMKERMEVLHAKMERLKAKANEDLELDGNRHVRLEHNPQLGYHFRITLKEDKELRKRKDYKVVQVVKSGVRFTNDKLSECSEKFCALRHDYEEQQRSIVAEIIQVAIGYAAPLTLLNNQLAQLDCLVSFAVAAQEAPIPYVRPQMLEEGAGVLELKQLRHPCLELQEKISYIANDVEMRKDESNMFIITGPNMGGKSTYIRSVGVAVLMAHVGAFVPCSAATISMMDSILARIGASDNVIKGLSTFMVEMIETSGIIRTATEKSLVIIDELGRGTSTYEGCGIAWSIAEHLAKHTKCFTLFATHFHEITQLAEMVSAVKNYHMAAIVDKQNFTLLYQVRPGATEKSFGIQVARLADFPDEVVDEAERFYAELEDQHGDMQTAEDKALLGKINKAIDQLASTGNNADIDEDDLSKMVEQFAQDIRQLDSEYFKAVLNETEK